MFYSNQQKETTQLFCLFHSPSQNACITFYICLQAEEGEMYLLKLFCKLHLRQHFSSTNGCFLTAIIVLIIISEIFTP